MGLGLSGLRLGLGQQLWGTVWSPAKLFPTGTEEGLFLDFSDISTLYTDQTFKTNISTYGDPVGGVIDKSQGGVPGDEGLADPNFDTGTGWSQANGWTISGGEAIHDGSVDGHLQGTTTGVPVGALAELTFTISEITDGAVKPRTTYGGGPIGIPTGYTEPGTYTARYIVDGGAGIYMRAEGNTNPIKLSFVSVRRVPGNHLVQSTSAARPIWTRHPKSGVRNLLDYSEDFSNVVWDKFQATGTSTPAIIPNTASGLHRVKRTVSGFTAGDTISLSVEVSETGYGQVQLVFVSGANYSDRLVDAASGEVRGSNDNLGSVFSSPVIATEVLGNGFCRVQYTINTATITSVEIQIRAATGDTASFAGDGTTATTFDKVQFEIDGPTPLQSRVSKYDVTEAGVDDCYGLTFDGVDDYLVTAANLDLSGTDEVTTCHGIFATGTNPGSVFVHGSIVNAAGRVGLERPEVADDTRAVVQLGNNQSIRSALPIPSGNVASILVGPSRFDLSLDGTLISGTIPTSANFANLQHDLGRRGNNTHFFTGTIYGATLTDYILDAEQLAALETWTAARTPEVTLA